MNLLVKFRWAVLALLLACCVTPAFAQGCAMCYANAKATPKDAQRTLNRAIFVMLVLPVAAMTIGVGAAFRYGKKRDQENENTFDQGGELLHKDGIKREERR